MRLGRELVVSFAAEWCDATDFDVMYHLRRDDGAVFIPTAAGGVLLLGRADVSSFKGPHDEKRYSRTQARLEATEEGVAIEALGGNPVVVHQSDACIPLAKHQSHALHRGDRFELVKGGQVFELHFLESMDPTRMTCAEVATWLTAAVPSEYRAHVCATVLEQEIDGEVLLSLTDADLKDVLGIAKFGPRRKLQQAIQRAKADGLTPHALTLKRSLPLDDDPSKRRCVTTGDGLPMLEDTPSKPSCARSVCPDEEHPVPMLLHDASCETLVSEGSVVARPEAVGPALSEAEEGAGRDQCSSKAVRELPSAAAAAAPAAPTDPNAPRSDGVGRDLLLPQVSAGSARPDVGVDVAHQKLQGSPAPRLQCPPDISAGQEDHKGHALSMLASAVPPTEAQSPAAVKSEPAPTVLITTRHGPVIKTEALEQPQGPVHEVCPPTPAAPDADGLPAQKDISALAKTVETVEAGLVRRRIEALERAEEASRTPQPSPATNVAMEAPVHGIPIATAVPQVDGSGAHLMVLEGASDPMNSPASVPVAATPQSASSPRLLSEAAVPVKTEPVEGTDTRGSTEYAAAAGTQPVVAKASGEISATSAPAPPETARSHGSTAAPATPEVCSPEDPVVQRLVGLVHSLMPAEVL